MNTHTHTPSQTQTFQPPRAKAVAAKEWGAFVDRLTERPMKQLSAFKHVDRRENWLTEYVCNLFLLKTFCLTLSVCDLNDHGVESIIKTTKFQQQDLKLFTDDHKHAN